MTQSQTLSSDYSLTPSEFEHYLELVVTMKSPTMVWGPAGVGKSSICQKVAEKIGAKYIDVRAIMLDPVDLRGVPSIDENNRTRWNPPVFLPPTDSDEKYIINLEELPTAPPMVQAALYQLALDRKIGEYTLPDGAAVIACGNRETDGGVYNRFSPALASRFHHVELRTDVDEWREWAVENDIAPQVIFFMQFKPELLHVFDARSKERTFPCPRTWEYVSKVVKMNGNLKADIERSVYVGIVGEAAACEFVAFLRCWRELPHPQTVINDPKNVAIPANVSSLLALCGALFRLVDDTNFENVVTFAKRLRPEISEFLIWSCVKKDPELQCTKAFIEWASLNS